MNQDTPIPHPLAFDDETLTAFVDGELDEARALAVEAALETDAALAARVEALAESRTLVREAYAPLADAPVPEHLVAAIRSRGADLRARAEAPNIVPLPRRKASAIRTFLPMAAAACVALVAGYGLGLSTGRVGDEADRPAIGGPLGGAVAAALFDLPAGEMRSLDRGERLQVVSTFRDASGALCREFELDAGNAPLLSVACRDGADWRLRFAAEAPRADGGFAPASSHGALDAYLEAIGAGEPLDADAERAALSGR